MWCQQQDSNVVRIPSCRIQPRTVYGRAVIACLYECFKIIKLHREIWTSGLGQIDVINGESARGVSSSFTDLEHHLERFGGIQGNQLNVPLIYFFT